MKKRKSKKLPTDIKIKLLTKSVDKLWECKALQDKVNLSQEEINIYQDEYRRKQNNINLNLIKLFEDLMKLVEVKNKHNNSIYSLFCSLFFWVLIALLFWKWIGV